MKKLIVVAAIALAAALPAAAGIGAWTALPSPGPSSGTLIYTIAGHPANPLLRYAGTQAGVYISRDGGLSWAASNHGIAPTPAGYVGINDLAVTASTIYIAPQYLQKSIDGGSTWLRTGWVSENPQALVLATDPHNAAVVYAGSNSGVYKSSDSAASWKYLSGTLPVTALAVDPQNPAVVLRAVASGIVRSIDAGANWTQVNSTLTSVKTIAFDPRHPGIVYAGTTGAGVHRSSDGGISWAAVNRCLPQGRCAPLTLDAASVRSIAFDAGNPAVVYLGATEGLYKSIDGGASWTQANNGPIGVSAMMLDPLRADTLIAAWGGKLYSYTFATLSDSDRIFNWAEATYPQVFAPAGAATQTISGYKARHYAATGSYLGSSGGNVYVYGAAFGGLVLVGTSEALLQMAAAAGY